MNEPLVIVALVLSAVAAVSALVAALRAGRGAPADASSTLQAQRVESELQNVVQSLTRINAAQAELDRLRQPMDDLDRKSTRLNSSHIPLSRMPSSA